LEAAKQGWFWGELLDNGISIDAFAPLSPGTWAALRGYWRGKNRHEREELKNTKKKGNKGKSDSEDDVEQKYRRRYQGQG
jgi:hypothetical protein